LKPKNRRYWTTTDILAVGVGAGVIYKGTDFISWLFWLASGKVLPGRNKAVISVLLAFFTTSIVYGLLLVDGGLIKYDYRGLLAVFGLSIVTAWMVYQRSKFKDKAGEAIQDGQGPPDPPFFPNEDPWSP
jgi:hypothetical protein